MKKYILQFIFILLFTSIFNSCSSEQESNQSNQGVIEFDISYPVKDFNLSMEIFLPKTMTMTYKNNVYKNEVANKLFTSIMISDCDKKQMTLILTYGKQKNIYTILNEQDIIDMFKSSPAPYFINNNTKEDLLGFICSKHYGIYNNLEDGHDFEILETTQIPIKNSNWCNQYSNFKGVLLGYEIEKYGMTMKFNARSINQSTSISDATFNIPEKHKKVSLDKFLWEMESIFSLVLN